VTRALLVTLIAAWSLAGCATARTPAPEVAVFGPAMAVDAPVEHWHAPGCPHPARWFAGRWIYFDDGRWEYTEGGRLYRYLRLESRPELPEKAERKLRALPRLPAKAIPYGEDVRPRLLGSEPRP
jgi:hypothetical protein